MVVANGVSFRFGTAGNCIYICRAMHMYLADTFHFTCLASQRIPCQCFDKQQQLPPTQHSAYPHIHIFLAVSVSVECRMQNVERRTQKNRLPGTGTKGQTDGFAAPRSSFSRALLAHVCCTRWRQIASTGSQIWDPHCQTGYADGALESQPQNREDDDGKTGG